MPRWALIVLGVGPLLAIFALLVWALVGGDSANPSGLSVNDETGEVRVVRAGPFQFTLPLIEGGEIALADLRGKVVLVDFWASWCVPCRIEAPTLERVWRRYRDRDVVFIGVNVWDKESDARDFNREFGATYPVGLDPKGTIAIEYGVTGIPEKYFIDRRGRIVKKLIGPMTEDRLGQLLDELLALP